MITRNIIHVLSLTAFISMISCSDHQHNLNMPNGNNRDTSYQMTTKELKSNQIPDSVFNMQNLRSLSIQGMDCDYGNHSDCWMITEIPSGIKNLSALTSLSFTVNAIKKIPEELGLLKHLKSIDLSDNTGLADFNAVTKLDSLESLYLSGCGISKMPDDIGKLKQLKTLGLQGNPIDSLEQIRIKTALPGCNILFK